MAAFGTRKGSFASGELSDTLLAVVVQTGQDLGVLEVAMANGARYFFSEFLQTFLDWIWTLRHLVASQRTRIRTLVTKYLSGRKRSTVFIESEFTEAPPTFRSAHA